MGPWEEQIEAALIKKKIVIINCFDLTTFLGKKEESQSPLRLWSWLPGWTNIQGRRCYHRYGGSWSRVVGKLLMDRGIHLGWWVIHRFIAVDKTQSPWVGIILWHFIGFWRDLLSSIILAVSSFDGKISLIGWTFSLFSQIGEIEGQPNKRGVFPVCFVHLMAV